MDAWSRHPTGELDAKKKSLIATERDAWRRLAFRVHLTEHLATEFIVVDECASNLNLTRRYARAPRGMPAIGAVPRNTPPNTTVIASMSTAGMGPALMISGATDAHVFEGYIAQMLAPTLRPGQIVVLDHLSAHKGRRVRELIEARGCQLWYLPPYSPDLSPIEHAFAKLKAWLRKVAARTNEALEQAVADGLDTISPDDAQGFFRHCGYRVLSSIAQLLYSPL